MPRQKRHANRVYQVVGEPGAIAVGYVRYSMELQDAASIVTQKRRITEFAEKKGWKLVRWYEEPEHSAKYEEIEQRPVFAQLLNDAGTRLQVALCYMNNRGHGTIETPSGELVEGKHQAAWPYDLWQRMVEVKAGKWRRPRKEAQRRPHEFSRIIVCAACCRALRVFLPRGIPYYKDASSVRKLECPALGFLSVKSATVIYQFGDILRSVELPSAWREAIAERCNAEVKKDGASERIRARRAELEAEQKRLISVFTKGYITEQDLDVQMERIRTELFTLPVPMLQDADEVRQAAISAGETLADMADYWAEATCEERRDMVWALLTTEGLVYDLERGFIVGLLPRPTVLPVLALGLESTGR